MTVHEFNPARAGEHDAHDWWGQWYRQAFPGYVTHDIVTERNQQRAGIDHRVRLDGGAEVLVDVKCRCQSKSWRDDFLVEVWSDVQGRRPGWARKPLHCQFVAYVWPQYEVGFLIPFHLLRLAYENHKTEWAELAKQGGSGFRVVDAENTTYTTRNVAVPLEEFTRSVAEAMTVYFSDEGKPF